MPSPTASDWIDDSVPTAAPTWPVLPENPSLYDELNANPFFYSILKGLVDTAHIQPLLKGEGKPINLTLFAPSNVQFEQLEAARPGILEELRADPVKLVGLLTSIRRADIPWRRVAATPRSVDISRR